MKNKNKTKSGHMLSDGQVLGTVLSVLEGETLGAAVGTSDGQVLGTVLSVVEGETVLKSVIEVLEFTMTILTKQGQIILTLCYQYMIFIIIFYGI